MKQFFIKYEFIKIIFINKVVEFYKFKSLILKGCIKLIVIYVSIGYYYGYSHCNDMQVSLKEAKLCQGLDCTLRFDRVSYMIIRLGHIMFDFDLTTTISVFIYTVLSLGCLKYFNYSSVDDDALLSQNHEKQKYQELLRLKKELDFINNDFNIKYADAMKGQFNKSDEE